MCGFFAYTGDAQDLPSFDKYTDRLKHRGPDHKNIFSLSEIGLGHHGVFVFHRLAIMDTSSNGHQPLIDEKKQHYLVCNGEVYNWRALRKKYHQYAYSSSSDCEPILPLYADLGTKKTALALDAEFAFVLYDAKKKSFVAARDPIGIRPLFYGFAKKTKKIMFGSEAKSLTPYCEKVEIFPPGHYYENGQFISYLDITNVLKASTDPLAAVLKNIKEKLIAGVEKRLDADVPVGFLLSGGLDSSLVCAIARRVLNKPITTFAIGMNINPIDLKYAKQAADFIGCHHHEVIFTDEDIKTHLSDVIFALETWDITTIRASIGMYLVCRYVKQKTKIKVLLTGEISDELLGYKYTDFAPSPEAFQKEAEKRIREIHFYDVLRADRSISAHGLEARVPFGDIDFVHYVMHIDPKLKINTTGIGKYLLRKAFEDGNYLPPDLLYRDKAAFSDAVGHRMVDYLKELAEEKYSDQQFEKKKKNFSHCPPMSKEALMYREIFEDFYPEQSHLIKDYWLPNREWENCNVTDPSARVLPNYGKSGH